jgi:hypothetical protein
MPPIKKRNIKHQTKFDENLISNVLKGKSDPIDEFSLLSSPPLAFTNFQPIFMPKIKVGQNTNNKLKSFAHEFLFVEDGEEGFIKAPTISMNIMKT